MKVHVVVASTAILVALFSIPGSVDASTDSNDQLDTLLRINETLPQEFIATGDDNDGDDKDGDEITGTAPLAPPPIDVMQVSQMFDSSLAGPDMASVSAQIREQTAELYRCASVGNRGAHPLSCVQKQLRRCRNELECQCERMVTVFDACFPVSEETLAEYASAEEKQRERWDDHNQEDLFVPCNWQQYAAYRNQTVNRIASECLERNLTVSGYGQGMQVDAKYLIGMEVSDNIPGAASSVSTTSAVTTSLAVAALGALFF